MKKQGVLLLSILFSLFLSCEIGLGSAVDTQVPEISIDTPEVGTIIRDSFSFRGTWSDDGSIKEIKLTLKTLENDGSGSVIYSKSCTIVNNSDSHNTWVCTINPIEESIKDGTYEATVKITDEADHSTIAIRQITLDNTAPVVVLTRPSTKKSDSDSDTYGQTVSIEGQAADDSGVSLIEMSVYGDESCTNLLDTIELKNVPNSIEMDVAKFGDEAYGRIYGNSKEGTKPLWCKITAYDGAQRYPEDGSEQSEQDKKGNAAKEYYLYSEIYSEILSNYKITELYAMMNGTYGSSSERSAASTDVKTKLGEKKVEEGRFSVNPDNDPTFTVTGLSGLKSGAHMTGENGNALTSYTVVNESRNLVIEVSPGLDKITIDPDSVEIWLERCDDEGKSLGEEKIVLLEKGQYGDARSTVGTSYKYTTGTIGITTTPGVKTDNFYKVCVSGKDTKGNPVKESAGEGGAEQVFAFYLGASGSMIDMSLERTPDYISTEEQAKTENKKAKVRIEYSYTDSVEGLWLYRSYEDNVVDMTDAERVTGVELPMGENQVYEDEIEAGAIKKSDGSRASKITYQLKTQDGNGFSRKKNVSVRFDNQKPVINDLKKPGTEETKGSSMTFTAEYEDGSAEGEYRSGIEQVRIKIENTENVGTESSVRSTGWLDCEGGRYTIKKSELPAGGVFESEGKKKVTVEVTDGVGLKKEREYEWIYDTADPVVTISGYKEKKEDGSWGSLNSVSGDSPVINSGKKIKLYGTVTDEWGIKSGSVKISQKKKGNTSSDEITVTYNAESGEWESEDLPKEANLTGSPEYEISISAEDKAANKTTKKVTLKIDLAAPEVEIENPGEGLYGEDSVKGSPDSEGKITYRLAGNATDNEGGLGLKRILYKIAEGKVNAAEVTESAYPESVWDKLDQSSSRWTINASLGTGEKTLIIKAEDNAGNVSGVQCRSFYVDNSEPAVKIKVSLDGVTYTEGSEYIYNENDAAEKIYVKVEADDDNGIKGTTLRVNGEAKTLTGGVYEITTEGDYSIEAEAEDISGMSGGSTRVADGRKKKVTARVLFDKTKPVPDVTNAADTEDNTDSQYWFSGSTIYLNVEAKDNESGAAERKIRIDGGAWARLATDELTYQYTVTDGFAENTKENGSVHTAEVYVKDKAGNENTVTRYFRYDKAAPSVSLSLNGEYLNGKDGSILTAEGNAYDNTTTPRPVEKAVIRITKDGESEGEGDSLTWSTAPINYGYYSKVIEGAELSEGKYTVKVTAEDYAGKSDEKSSKITVDKTEPEVTAVEVGSESITTGNTAAKWQGSKTVSIAVSADDKTSGGIKSGIGSVYGGIESKDSENNTVITWTQFTPEGGKYKGTVTFKGEKEQNLYIKAVDKAGNEYEREAITVKIDTSAPEARALLYTAEGGKLKKTGGTVYANGTKKIIILGEYSDEESGVKELGLKLGNTAIDSSKVTYSQTALAGNETEIPDGFTSYNSIVDKTTIRSWKAEITPTESLQGQLTVTGYNGTYEEGEETGKKEEKSFTITLDKVGPEFSRAAIEGTGSYDSGSIWYVKDGKYTVSGVCDDKLSGLDSISLEVTDKNNKKHTYKNSGTTAVWKFEKEIIKTTGANGITTESEEDAEFTQSVFGDGEVTAKLKVSDNAGNETEETLSIKFDNEEPQFKHETDSSEKDLLFRIGKVSNWDENDNLNEEYGVAKDTSEAKIDDEVGNKYKSDTYGKDTTITLKGRADDNEGGSGIKMLYYKVYTGSAPDVSTEAKRTELINEVKESPNQVKTGSEKEKRVFYNVSEEDEDAGKTLGGTNTGHTDSKGYRKYWKKVKTNYEATMNDFAEGENYLVIVAEDNTGNLALNSVNIGDTDYYICTLNVDTTKPTVISDIDETRFSNGKNTISLSGYTDDNAAGIKSVKIKFGDTEHDAVLTAEDETSATPRKREWSYELDCSELGITESSKSNITVYAVAKDNAGNEDKCNAVTITPDVKAPEVKLTKPKDADGKKDGIQVNGTIDIEGSASDTGAGLVTEKEITTGGVTSKEKTLILYYTTKESIGTEKPTETGFEEKASAAEGWKKLSEAEHGLSFTFPGINTASLAADGNKVYLTACAKDAAGNEGYAEPVTLEVDQNTDRPRISFQTIKLGNAMGKVVSGTEDYSGYVWLKNQTVIKGSVSDDDGEIKNLWISLDGTDWSHEVTDGLDKESGEFEYDLKNFYSGTEYDTDTKKEIAANGPKKIYFKVKDAEDEEFESKEAWDLKAVYLADGDNLYGEKGSGKKNDSIMYLKTDTIPPEVIVKGVRTGSSGEFESNYTSLKIGGDNDTVCVKFTATDANGIEACTGSAEYVYTESGIQKKLSVNGTVSEETENGAKVYILTVKLSSADLNTLKTKKLAGSVNIKVTGEDTAGNTSSQTPSIQYDYRPAAVKLLSPKESEDLSGEVTAFGSVDETATLRYAVQKDGVTPAEVDYKEIKGVSSSWSLVFDGKPDGETQTHAKTLNKYIIDLGIADRDTNSQAEDAIVSTYTDYVPLKLWIESHDGAGNKETSSFTLTVDPQGDRPSMVFSYPQDGATLGGTVSIYGTATDTKGRDGNIGVDSVWVQVVSTTHEKDSNASAKEWGEIENFEVTADDLTYLKDKGNYKVYNMKDYDATKTEAQNADNEWNGSGDPSEYAALVSPNGAAWTLDINAEGEFDPASGSQANNIAIRVIARDKDGKFSREVIRKVSVDADTPVIKDRVLFQAGSIDGAHTADRAYEKDMFVKDAWYLSGTVEDKDMISYLKVEDAVLVSGELKDKADGSGKEWVITTADKKDADNNVVAKAVRSADGKTVTFTYLLATGSGNGSLDVSITAKDAVTTGTPHTASDILNINYDNTAPVSGGIISSDIQQKNGWYTFGAKADESGDGQSGFAYTAFYFERSYGSGANAVKKVYDVLKKRAEAETDISTTAKMTAAGLVYDTQDSLYWYKNTAESVNGSVLTISSGKGLRKNALVKINGSYYLITEVNGSDVTLNNAPAGDVSTVYVALAGIVDNTTSEKASEDAVKGEDGYYTSFVNDDGDRMLEDVIKTSSVWTWEASINSKNIPDGPIELHYVLFDQAGNCRPEIVTGTVSNNRPRIAGITVKTDYNGDGDADDEGETIESYSTEKSYTEYYTGTKGGKKVYDPDEKVYGTNAKNPLKTSETFGSETTPVAVLRGYTELEAEIVGGNNNIYYEYSVGDKATAAKKRNTSRAIITSGSTDYTAENGTIYIQAGDLYGFDDADSKAFNFTFWDSTEGAVNLKNAAENEEPTSQKAELTVYFGIKLKSVGEPVVKISPFYWESITSNSVEKEGSPKKYTDLLGHIELEEDLPGSFTAGAADKLMDRDAKVSGKIVLEGTAHDDKLIDEINADIFGTPKLLAKYSNGKLGSKKSAYDAEGWYFEVKDKTGKDGHDVEWKLHVDTQVLGVAGLDKSVTVTATNFGSATYSTSGGTLVGIDGTTKYSTTVSYSGAKSNNPADDNSTARGKTTWETAKNAVWSENSVFTDITFRTAVQRRVPESGDAVYYVLDADGNEHVMADTDVVYINSSRTAKYRMDIVPYIREVKTSLSEVNTGNPTVYSRTALGHYPVYVTFASGNSAANTQINYSNRVREEIQLTGFNLAGSTLNFENDDPNTLKKGTGTNQNANGLVDDADSVVTLDDALKGRIPKGAGSGHVYASITIGEGNDAVIIKSLNNLNDNNAKGSVTTAVTGEVGQTGDATVFADYYNRQPNGINNNRLTDDVYIDVWEFNSEAAKPINNSALDIMMKVNPTSGLIGFAFCDGDLFWSMANDTKSYDKYAYTADFIQCTGFAYDKSGNSYGTALGGESGDTYGDSYRFYVNGWGNDSGKGYDTRTDTTHSIRIGSSNVGTYDSLMKDRYKSPSIAADASGNNVYIAYFDMSSGDLRFQGGSKDGKKFGTLQESYNNVSADIGNAGQKTLNTLEGERNFLQVVATSDGKDLNGKTYQKSGQYVSIGVTSTNKVVMVWYNGKDLLYSYNSNPTELHTGVNREGWTETPITLLSNAGKYCQLVVDSDDNVHVAAWDSSKGDLKYVYIPNDKLENLKTSDILTCTVDSYGTVGKELTIDVAKDANNNQIPYIGYFGNTPKKPRYAYIANIPKKTDGTSKAQSEWTSSDIAGVSGDLYTGIWECSISPTDDVVTSDETRRINVAVWKYNGNSSNDGQLAYSTTGTNYGKINGDINYMSSYTNPYQAANTGDDKMKKSTNTGYCYGNGSKNGVLGYGVRSGSYDLVETAQKR